MSILTDGFPTRLSFADAYSGVELYFKEKELTPPGIDMGEMNDVTNMQNTAWRTFAFKKLKTLMESGMVCHYDPAFLSEVLSMMGQNQELTLTLPDESTWTFWGGLRSFVPSAMSEGQVPTAQVQIGVTNHNGLNGALGTEVAPVYAAS
jgi:hypothetical protein